MSLSSGAKRLLPRCADVVIVGGGLVGVSILHHLVKMSGKVPRKFVLLERNSLTSGTTWHSTGLVWGLSSDETCTRVARLTMQTIREVAGTGERATEKGWTQRGTLFLACTKERSLEHTNSLAMYKAIMQQTRGNDELSEREHPRILTAEQIDELMQGTLQMTQTPDIPSIISGLHVPTDGVVSTTDLVNTLIKRIKKNSAVYNGKTNEDIKGKDTSTCATVHISEKNGFSSAHNHMGEEWEIKTENRDVLHAKHLVVASGLWTERVLQKIKMKNQTTPCRIPIRAMQRFFVVTANEGMSKEHKLPIIADKDLCYYATQEGSNGWKLGGYDQNPSFSDIDNIGPWTSLDLDSSAYEPHLNNATNRIKPLQADGVTIKSIFNGPEAYTPDALPIVGRLPGMGQNLHIAAGFSGSGVMLGPGVAKIIASEVLGFNPLENLGDDRISLYKWRASRFGENTIGDDWVEPRCREAMANKFSVVHSKGGGTQNLHENTRNIKVSPLHEILLAKGAIMMTKPGEIVEFPAYFLEEAKTNHFHHNDFNINFAKTTAFHRSNVEQRRLIENDRSMAVIDRCVDLATFLARTEIDNFEKIEKLRNSFVKVKKLADGQFFIQNASDSCPMLVYDDVKEYLAKNDANYELENVSKSNATLQIIVKNNVQPPEFNFGPQILTFWEEPGDNFTFGRIICPIDDVKVVYETIMSNSEAFNMGHYALDSVEMMEGKLRVGVDILPCDWHDWEKVQRTTIDTEEDTVLGTPYYGGEGKLLGIIRRTGWCVRQNKLMITYR